LKKYKYKILVRIKKLLLFPKHAYNYYNSGKLLNTSVQLKMNVSLLLALQFEDEFTRKDVIIRYKAFKDKFYEDDNDSLLLYKKLMTERFKEKPYKNKIEDSFDTLFKSIENHGFNDNYPIEVNSQFKLLDGSHRLSAAIVNGIDEVPISVVSTKNKILFNTRLLERYNFNKSELASINESETRLFLDLGVYFPVIIWPPAMQFIDEIEKSLNYEIKLKCHLELDCVKFESFVREIYEVDDIEDWKVDKKLNAMQSDINSVSVFFINFNDPLYRKKSRNSALISMKGEKLKEQIRSTYKSKIQNYIYDIIVHTGDNFIHNKKIMQITNAYLNDK